jgi:predicted ATP-dependent endonuclease of OLD family
MHIEFVEIANFRKLHCTRVGFAADKTVFVGANNSGKTSAMLALRYFLIRREQSQFSLNDFTLSHWQAIDALGKRWEVAKAKDEALPDVDFGNTLPFLDVWLNAELSELQYVKDILPNLEWAGGRLGVRLMFEAKEPRQLQADYLSARADAQTIQGGNGAGTVNIWPESLTKFLERRLGSHFEVKAYKLDPAKCVEPSYGFAAPQPLADSAALDFDPFKGLILIHEISAQRGFGQTGPLDVLDDDDDARLGSASAPRKLSEQLRRYYSRHLNPYAKPDAQDITALKAIEEAQKAFDLRLKEGFAAAISEMEKLGYPGITDPQLLISTRLRPVDGLNHEAAVQYVIRGGEGESAYVMRLPEDSNGLGYQNLISMVFRLMSFRDAWMRVGKAKSKSDTEESIVAPLHLVLIEEPEAHLHTQVQQVFIRQAYRILRNHAVLGDDKTFTTQMVVSTHSSHIAHESDYGALRYFRRMPAKDGEIPTSRVVNLTNVFGSDTETRRFVTRYLKITHCDLFFADAAVLIEGPVERILAPHFVRYQPKFEALNESYITWLEISGSHAHRLRELIEQLGLTTLIITDLDAMDADNISARPQKGAGQKTRNVTLKTWCPAKELLDDLLAATDEAKVKTYKDQQFSIRVAYQCPVEVTFKGATAEALAYTLEDALAFANLPLLEKHQGKGLLAKFKDAIENSADIPTLSDALLAALKGGGKAEMALDLLDLERPAELKPPPYIQSGLEWLMDQLNQKQKELGLPIGTDAGRREAQA